MLSSICDIKNVKYITRNNQYFYHFDNFRKYILRSKRVKVKKHELNDIEYIIHDDAIDLLKKINDDPIIIAYHQYLKIKPLKKYTYKAQLIFGIIDYLEELNIIEIKYDYWYKETNLDIYIESIKLGISFDDINTEDITILYITDLNDVKEKIDNYLLQYHKDKLNLKKYYNTQNDDEKIILDNFCHIIFNNYDPDLKCIDIYNYIDILEYNNTKSLKKDILENSEYMVGHYDIFNNNQFKEYITNYNDIYITDNYIRKEYVLLSVTGFKIFLAISSSVKHKEILELYHRVEYNLNKVLRDMAIKRAPLIKKKKDSYHKLLDKYNIYKFRCKELEEQLIDKPDNVIMDEYMKLLDEYNIMRKKLKESNNNKLLIKYEESKKVNTELTLTLEKIQKMIGKHTEKTYDIIVEPCKGSYLKKNDLWKRYKNYCEENKIERKKQYDFYKIADEHYGAPLKMNGINCYKNFKLC